MSEKTQRPSRFVEKSGNIMGVDGNHCMILGTTILTTDFFNRKVNVEYHVVEKAPYDGILGRNFISRHIDRISYAEQRMYFKSINPTKGGYLRKEDKKALNLAIAADQVPNTSLGRLVRTQFLKPHQEKWVKVYPTKNICARKVEVCDKDKLNENMRVIRSIQDGTLGVIPCLIRNISDKNIWLKKEAVVARINKVYVKTDNNMIIGSKMSKRRIADNNTIIGNKINGSGKMAGINMVIGNKVSNRGYKTEEGKLGEMSVKIDGKNSIENTGQIQVTGSLFWGTKMNFKKILTSNSEAKKSVITKRAICREESDNCAIGGTDKLLGNKSELGLTESNESTELIVEKINGLNKHALSNVSLANDRAEGTPEVITEKGEGLLVRNEIKIINVKSDERFAIKKGLK